MITDLSPSARKTHLEWFSWLCHALCNVVLLTVTAEKPTVEKPHIRPSADRRDGLKRRWLWIEEGWEGRVVSSEKDG